MWSPAPEILAAALEHAAACQPRESCGVVAGGKYHPIDNIMTGLDTFAMDMVAYLKIAKKNPIEAIVHSHVYEPPMPSDADKTMCETTAKPWLIVNWPLGTWSVLEPSGFKAPLIGRAWAWGCHDCWTLVRDAFEHFTGVHMPDLVAEWAFWERGEDFLVDHFDEIGLVPVDDPQWRHCDVAAMQIWPSKLTNHMGLILSPDLLLHQLAPRLSIREVYGGVWAKCTRYHLRHKQFLEAPPPIPDDYQQWRARP